MNKEQIWRLAVYKELLMGKYIYVIISNIR